MHTFSKHDVALAASHGDRDNLVLEHASSLCSLGLVLRRNGKMVLHGRGGDGRRGEVRKIERTRG